MYYHISVGISFFVAPKAKGARDVQNAEGDVDDVEVVKSTHTHTHTHGRLSDNCTFFISTLNCIARVHRHVPSDTPMLI